MSDLVDPGKRARRQARAQAELLKRQKQKEQLIQAETEDELAKKKAAILNPAKGRGRMSLLGDQAKRPSLG